MASRMRSRSRASILATLLLTLVLALAACTGPTPGPTPGPTSGPSEPAKTLTVGATLEPPTMDPSATAAASVPQVLLYNVYETLVKLNAEGELKPLLADRWDLSTDRKTYTFHLNPAAKFATGEKVTADAVVKSIERFRASKVASHKAQMALVSEAKAVGEETVEVTLTRPSNLWLYDMTSTVGMVINPAGFDSLDTATAGSGPLQLQKWTARDSVTLERNKDYWGTPVRFDTVTFKYFADANAMSAAMLADQLDVVSNLQAPDSLGSFSDTGRFTILEGVTSGEVVLSLNNKTPALADVRVRRAIAMAIDKRKLMDTVWNGKGALIGSMSVPLDPYYEDLTGVNAYNPEQAKALLTEAGATGLTLRLKPAATPYATKSAQVVANMLSQVGIKTTIEELQFSRWLDTVYTKGDYDLSIVAHVEARDLGNFANPEYYWRYDNPAFAAAWLAADEAPASEFAPKMKEAARILADDAAAVWLFALPNLVITKSTITGVPADMHTLSFDVTTIASR